MSIAIKQDEGGDAGAVEFIMPTIEGIDFVNYINEEQLDDVMRLVGQDLSEPYSIFTYRYFLHRWPQLCILAVPTDADDGDGSEETKTGGTPKYRRPIGCVVCKIDIDDGEPSEGDNVIADAMASAADDEASGDKSFGNGEEANSKDTDQTDHNSSTEKINVTQINDTTTNIDKVYTGYIGMLAVEHTHRRSGIGTALVQRAIRRMQQMGCQSIRLETEVTNKAAMNLYEDRLGFVREELLKKYYLNWGDAYRLRLWLDG